MGLKTNLKINIFYENRNRNIAKYESLLTEEQANGITSVIEKTYIINDLYAKIGTINGGKDQLNLRLDFFNTETKDALLESKDYKFTPNLNSGDNFIKQGYEYLKTLPEYADAIDILEE